MLRQVSTAVDLGGSLESQRKHGQRDVRLEEVHCTVEMVQAQLARTIDADILGQPLLVAVQLRRWRHGPIGDHRKQRTLDRVRSGCLLTASRDRGRESEPLPQLLKDPDVAVRPRVDDLSARKLRQEVFQCDPPQNTAGELSELLDSGGIVDPTEVVDDARLGPLLLAVPNALSDLVVLDGGAVLALLGGGSQIHVSCNST